MQGALLSGLCAFAGQNGSFTEGDLNQLEACQKKLARRLVAMTRRNLDTEPKKRQISTNELHRKLGIVPIEMKLRIQRLGWGKKTAECLQNDDLCHRQVLAAVFGQTRMEKFPWMTEDEKLTPCATPWAKQFQDYINSLKEFEGATTSRVSAAGDHEG